uniref:Trichohyalin-like n=1 Tax=Saccoglossus kowalevskii TaxID=10224 RepID=A0ABM0MF88_SACKO|nr:PREDICTED: trichohyalin-like [Saccoglossus kowalevskii]
MPSILSLRKSRLYQTSTEKLENMQHMSRAIRHRAEFLNKQEKAHLRMRTKQIESNEYAVMGSVYRLRDYMKIDLIDMHKSKKKIQRSVTEFEQSLKEGTNLPVFKSEYERLRKKQRRLEKLEVDLRGPNSYSLAKDLNSQLKLVNLTYSYDTENKKVHGFNLPPIDANPNTTTTEEAPLSDAEKIAQDENEKEQQQKEEEEKKESERLLQEKRQSPLRRLSKKLDNNNNILLPTNPAYRQLMQIKKEQEEEAERLKLLEEAEIEKKRKEEAAKPLPPLRETLFADMNLKMPKKFVRSRSPVSGSLLRRKLHAERRIKNMKVQSRSDVDRKLSNSITSLNKMASVSSSGEQNTKTSPRGSDYGDNSSTVAASEAGSKLTRRKHRRSEGGLILPPIKVDISMLKEIKEHRIRHKKESTGLPHLP